MDCVFSPAWQRMPFLTRDLFPPPFCPHLHPPPHPPPSTLCVLAGALPTFVNHLHDMLRGETLPITNICGPCSFVARFWQPGECHGSSQCVLHSREGSAGALWYLPQVSEWQAIPLSSSVAHAATIWSPKRLLYAQSCTGHVCNAKYGSAHRLGWGHEITGGGGSHERTWRTCRVCPLPPSSSSEQMGHLTCPLLPGRSTFKSALNGLTINITTFPKELIFIHLPWYWFLSFRILLFLCPFL